jgi:hypothetical protein
VLDKLMQLRGVFYNWIDRESHGDQVNIGFIAQELEPYFPELVRTDTDGYKSVTYGKMSAVLVEAVKELNDKLDQKDKELDSLQSELDSLRSYLCAKDASASLCQ